MEFQDTFQTPFLYQDILDICYRGLTDVFSMVIVRNVGARFLPQIYRPHTQSLFADRHLRHCTVPKKR